MTGTPQPGDMGLVRIKGIVGWLIQFGELIYDGNWRWSHAFIYLGNGYIMEAEPGGARIAKLSEYDGRKVLWSTRQLSDETRQRIVAAALACRGVPYNWMDYVALFLWRTRLRFRGKSFCPKWVRNRIADTSHLICSQLDDYVWTKAGEKVFDDGRLSGFVTPGALGREILSGRL